MRVLPITANLNPLGGANNWLYLLESAALARLITGGARVWENRPSVQDPSLSPAERRQPALERFFVEIIGTIGYILCLHLGQDFTSKLLEPALKRHRQVLLEQIDKQAPNLTKAQVQKAKDAITEVYGSDTKNLISRFIYGYTAPNNKRAKVSLARIRTLIGDNTVFEYLRSATPLDTFASSLRRRTAFSILGGVFISALYGGLVTQWLNDRVFAPAAHKILSKRYNASPAGITPETNTQFAGPNGWSALSQAPSMPVMAPQFAAPPVNAPALNSLGFPLASSSYPTTAPVSPFNTIPMRSMPGGLA